MHAFWMLVLAIVVADLFVVITKAVAQTWLNSDSKKAKAWLSKVE